MQPTVLPSVLPSTEPTRRCPVVPTSLPEYEMPRVGRIELLSTETSSVFGSVSTNISVIVSIDAVEADDASTQPLMVYCDAFESVRGEPETVFDVLRRGFGAFAPASMAVNRTVNVTIGDLYASTLYTVYCLPVSSQQTIQETSLSAVLAVNLTVASACCKVVYVSLQSTWLREYNVIADVVSVQLNAAPSSELMIALHASTFIRSSPIDDDGNKGAEWDTFYPTRLNISTLSWFLAPNYVHTFLFNAGSAAVHEIMAVLSGESAAEYVLHFVNDRYLNVIGEMEEPPTPVLRRALFSPDGTSLLVYFTLATNRRDSGDVAFECADIFAFSGVELSLCRWESDTTARVFLEGDTESVGRTLNVGDPLTVLSGSTLRAKCDMLDCAQWLEVEEQTVMVEAPAVALMPKVSVATARAVAPCADIVLDLTSSTGSAGMAWAAARLDAFDNGVFCDKSDLQYFLHSAAAALGPLLTIPNTLLTEGHKYVFQVTLCNFLHACGRTIVDVQVHSNDTIFVDPTMYIRGAVNRHVYASQNVSFTPAFSVVTCSDSGALASSLDLSSLTVFWSIHELTSSGATLVYSYSPSIGYLDFSLPPSVLQPLGQYKIMLESIYQSSLHQYSAYLYVEQSDIIAVMTSNNGQAVATSQQLSLLLGDSISMSASESYTMDILTGDEVSTGAAAGLVFKWSCMVLSPVFNASCTNILHITSGNGNDRVTAFRDDFAADLETVLLTSVSTLEISPNETVRCRVTVAIRDDIAAPHRFSMAYTDVVISLNSATLVLNVATANRHWQAGESQVVVVNPDKNVHFQANLLAQEACTLEWVNNGGVSRSMDVLTSAAVWKPAGFSGDIGFVLPASSIPPRAAVTFELSCALSVASATIYVNGPPLPGAFHVFPSIGFAMHTEFTMQATQWTDAAADLPLYYQFGVLIGDDASSDNATAAGLVLLSLSDHSRGTTLLPATVEYAGIANYSHLCTVSIFDVYMAGAVSWYEVSIISVPSSESLELTLELLTTGASDTPDEMHQIISNAVSVFSGWVNCTLLPLSVSDCSTWNRAPCAATAHTCGSCLAGYIGEPGDHNSYCLSSLSLVEPVACANDGDCLPQWSTCNTTTKGCVAVSKARTLSCPAQSGTLVYINRDSGFELQQCLIDAPNCAVLCRCDAGYSGTSCELHDDATAVESLRSGLHQLLDMLESLMDIEAATPLSVDVWAKYMSYILRDPHQLLATDIPKAYNMTMDIVARAIAAREDTSLSASTLESYASLAESMDGLFSVEWARAYDENAGTAVTNSASQLLAFASVYAELVSQSLVVDQAPLSLLLENLRVYTFLKDLSGSDLSQVSSDIITVGRSAYEAFFESDIDAQVLFDSFGIDARRNMLATTETDHWSTVRMTVVSLKPRAFEVSTASLLVSNPIHVESSVVLPANASSSLSFPSFQVSITLPHIDPWPTEEFSRNQTLYCTGPSDKTDVSFTCLDSGLEFHHSCSGASLARGYYTYRCPRAVEACGELAVDAPGMISVNHRCQVERSNAASTVCRCTVSAADWTVTSTSSAFVSLSVAIVHRYEPYGDEEADVIKVAATNVQKSMIAASLCILIWVLTVLAYCNLSIHQRTVLFKEPGHNLYASQNQATTRFFGSSATTSVLPISDSAAKVDSQYGAATGTCFLSNYHGDREQYRRDAFSQKQNLGTLLKLYVELLFPVVYSHHLTWRHLLYEMLSHHPFFMLFSFRAKQYTGWKRFWIIAQMVTTQSVLMFVLFCLYDHQDPPDGKQFCKQFDSMSTCLERVSFLDNTQLFCQWNVYSEHDVPAVNHSCTYNPRRFTIKVIMYAIILSSIIAAVMDVPITALCDAYLISVDTSTYFKHTKGEEVNSQDESSSDSDDADESESGRENERSSIGGPGGAGGAGGDKAGEVRSMKDRRASVGKLLAAAAGMRHEREHQARSMLIYNPLGRHIMSALRSVGLMAGTLDMELNSCQRLFPERFSAVLHAINKQFAVEYGDEAVAAASVAGAKTTMQRSLLPFMASPAPSQHWALNTVYPSSANRGRGNQRRRAIRTADSTSHLEEDTATTLAPASHNRRSAARQFSFMNLIGVSEDRDRQFSISNPFNLMRSKRTTRISRAAAALEVASDLLGQLAKQKARLLLPKDIEEFDREWGVLDSIYNHSLRGHKTVLPTPEQEPQFSSSSSTNALNLTPAMLHGMAEDIRTSNELSVLWKRCIDEFPLEQKSFALMYVFLLDLLGRGSLSAKLVAAKLDIDFPRIFKVSFWQSIAVAVFIALLNIAFVGYVLGKGQEREFSWHKGYVFTLLILWALDMFVMHTVEVFLVNLAVPFIACGNVDIAKAEMHHLMSQVASHCSKHMLHVDVPSYLFTSKKLSKLFPSLVESRILSHYRPYLPGLSSKRWRLVEWTPTKYYTWWDIWVVPVFRVPPYVYKLVVWYGEKILVMLLFNKMSTRMFFPLMGSAFWLLFFSLQKHAIAASVGGFLLFLAIAFFVARHLVRLRIARQDVAAKVCRYRQHAAFQDELLASNGRGKDATAAGRREQRRRLVVAAALQQSASGVNAALQQHALSVRAKSRNRKTTSPTTINGYGDAEEQDAAVGISSSDSPSDSDSSTCDLASLRDVSNDMISSSPPAVYDSSTASLAARKVSVLALVWSREIHAINAQLNSLVYSIGVLDSSHLELSASLEKAQAERLGCQSSIVEWTSAFTATHGYGPSNRDKEAIRDRYMQYQRLKKQCISLESEAKLALSEHSSLNKDSVRLKRSLDCLKSGAAAYHASVHAALVDFGGAIRWRARLKLLSQRAQDADLEAQRLLESSSGINNNVQECILRYNSIQEVILAWTKTFSETHGRDPTNADKASIRDKYVDFRAVSTELKALRTQQEAIDKVVEEAQRRVLMSMNEVQLHIVAPTRGSSPTVENALEFKEVLQLSSDLTDVKVDETWLTGLLGLSCEALKAYEELGCLQSAVSEADAGLEDMNACLQRCTQLDKAIQGQLDADVNAGRTKSILLLPPQSLKQSGKFGLASAPATLDGDTAELSHLDKQTRLLHDASSPSTAPSPQCPPLKTCSMDKKLEDKALGMHIFTAVSTSAMMVGSVSSSDSESTDGYDSDSDTESTSLEEEEEEEEEGEEEGIGDESVDDSSIGSSGATSFVGTTYGLSAAGHLVGNEIYSLSLDGERSAEEKLIELDIQSSPDSLAVQSTPFVVESLFARSVAHDSGEEKESSISTDTAHTEQFAPTATLWDDGNAGRRTSSLMMTLPDPEDMRERSITESSMESVPVAVHHDTQLIERSEQRWRNQSANGLLPLNNGLKDTESIEARREMEDEYLCAVCLERPALYLVVPCGHQCGCKPCLQMIYATTRQCPICRLHISSGPVKVYQTGFKGSNPNPDPNSRNSTAPFTVSLPGDTTTANRYSAMDSNAAIVDGSSSAVNLTGALTLPPSSGDSPPPVEPGDAQSSFLLGPQEWTSARHFPAPLMSESFNMVGIDMEALGLSASVLTAASEEGDSVVWQGEAMSRNVPDESLHCSSSSANDSSESGSVS